MGGGTTFAGIPDLLATGLSPRGRGNPGLSRNCLTRQGSIPAWAGEPRHLVSAQAPNPVYPRVGGGTWAMVVVARRSIRSIPAWAGEPLHEVLLKGISRVYPRVGGGTNIKQCPVDTSDGLSPRGRGNRGVQRRRLPRRRSIPAWAGEPALARSSPSQSTVYPRVGGGTLKQLRSSFQSPGLSPRGRGNLRAVLHPDHSRRSIPAWAGEPASRYARTAMTWVYPRVGGGTSLVVSIRRSSPGLSPRGRGNRPRPR